MLRRAVVRAMCGVFYIPHSGGHQHLQSDAERFCGQGHQRLITRKPVFLYCYCRTCQDTR